MKTFVWVAAAVVMVVAVAFDFSRDISKADAVRKVDRAHPIPATAGSSTMWLSGIKVVDGRAQEIWVRDIPMADNVDWPSHVLLRDGDARYGVEFTGVDSSGRATTCSKIVTKEEMEKLVDAFRTVSAKRGTDKTENGKKETGGKE